MGLETSTFLSGLTATWPLSGDKKNQGDDHIRLIKATLQATFPSADRAFYFPKTEAISGTLVLDATDQNNLVEVTTSGGNVTVTLPAGLGVGDKGFALEVVKVSNDANAAIVAAAAGSINSGVGAVATVRVGILCAPTKFVWNGTAWYAFKSGPPIGTTENFDGVTTPPGYLDADGSAFSSTNFAELFVVLASSVVKDKRGRIEAGVDGGANRLTSTYFGTAAILGAIGGGESHPLTLAQIPTGISSANAAQNISLPFTNVNFGGTVAQAVAAGGISAVTGNSINSGNWAAANSISVTSTNTGGGAHPNVQPTIVVKKIVRAC